MVNNYALKGQQEVKSTVRRSLQERQMIWLETLRAYFKITSTLT